MLIALFLGNGTVEYNEFIRMMNRYSEKTANCPDAEMLEAFRGCKIISAEDTAINECIYPIDGHKEMAVVISA
ncbi:hypothetical protein TSMEX_000989 [Taenia solium]|eukprot:TsM_000242800 transcript=TsM_000242800 gene=TsM_000242800